MLVGHCPQCQAIYCGWALKSPWHQTCERCGVQLEIKDQEDDLTQERLEKLLDKNLHPHSDRDQFI